MKIRLIALFLQSFVRFLSFPISHIEFHIARMLKICVIIFSATIQATLFKLGRLAVNVIENPGFNFSLLIKPRTIFWVADFDIYYSFLHDCITKAAQRAYGQFL